ncbi:contractile injection system protein, VgrG/Pvc8 family [Pseudomonas asplenii]|uniref:contractile injection system protein, VgrG/Pvc8 family n=1 Tax=Pseudomonas asplenii TaxID=53407 RepID=UPI0003757171|nr:contractile injection system protein, VgrG/Pvc8 family [Pseudomonas fuscovaginae]
MFDPANQPFFRLDVAGLSRPLAVTSFSGREAVSELFAFELDLPGDTLGTDPDRLMYRSCFLRLGAADEGIHAQIQGVNLRCADLAPGHCRLSLGPRLGLLAQRLRRRLFQQRTVPGIIAQVLGEHGLRDDAFRFVLKARCVPRPYCVQFDESDLEFVQRLCAEEGIHFHFQHSRDNHRLVFSDGLGALRRTGEARFCPDDGPGVEEFQVSLSARLHRRGGRSQELAQGESDLPGLHCAAFLPLSGHPRKAWNRLWLITALEHRGDSSPLEPWGPFYRNLFRATSWEVAPRTPRRYPKPRLSGLFRARLAAGKPRTRDDGQAWLAVQLRVFYQGEGARQNTCRLPLDRLAVTDVEAFVAGLEEGTPLWVRFVDGDPDRPRIIGRADARQLQVQPAGDPFCELLRTGHPLVRLCPPAPDSLPASCGCRGCLS